MGKKIYGVDLDDEITPIMVRDAVVECFVQAHREILEQIKKYDDCDSKEKLEKMERTDVKLLIKRFFREVDGDFDKPTKETITKVCQKLAEFSENFRKPEIIEKHYGEIMQLLERIKHDKS